MPKRFTGFFAQHPEQVTTHAISVALTAAAGMVGAKHAKALVTICADQKLCERASTLVLRHMLLEMADQSALDGRAFQRLVVELAALTLES